MVRTRSFHQNHTLDIRLSDVRESFEEGGSEVGF